jgi:DNA invertase Pin-like site-specific DNA recombinase
MSGKLKACDVRAIGRLRHSGVGTWKIARIYKVSRATVKRIFKEAK